MNAAVRESERVPCVAQASKELFADAKRAKRAESARRAVETRKKRRGIEHKMQVRIFSWAWRAFPPGCGVWFASWDPLVNSSRAGHFRRLRGIRSGVPDMVFIRPRCTAWIELKAERKVPVSKEQRAQMAAQEAAGCRTAVCYSAEQVEAQLRAWGFKPAMPYQWFPVPAEFFHRGPRHKPKTRLAQTRADNRFRRWLESLPHVEPKPEPEPEIEPETWIDLMPLPRSTLLSDRPSRFDRRFSGRPSWLRFFDGTGR